MLGGADNPNGELPSYITGADIEAYVCTSFVQAHRQCFFGAIDRLPVRSEMHLHVLLSHRFRCGYVKHPVFPDIF